MGPRCRLESSQMMVSELENKVQIARRLIFWRPSEGSVLRYVDMCPGHESPMHRTLR